MVEDTGGAAFQHTGFRTPEGLVADIRQEGITLRDYFAAQAIAGMGADIMFRMGPKDVITRALEIADAMLEARK